MSDNSVVVTKKKKKFKIFPLVNGLIFILISLAIMLPIWKVIIDSFDARSAYGFKWVPTMFTWGGYRAIVTRVALYRPFGISCIVTIVGTFLGLLLVTLGGYVLIQWEMPGRNFFAYMLLFTMIFDGGMIPKYLVMKQLHLLNTLWSVILPLSINVYNLVLMRNFFEGIPEALFEAAKIDGCSPMGIFFKIVLPLSKAALTSRFTSTRISYSTFRLNFVTWLWIVIFLMMTLLTLIQFLVLRLLLRFYHSQLFTHSARNTSYRVLISVPLRSNSRFI